MEEMTLDQQKALAMASARQRASEADATPSSDYQGPNDTRRGTYGFTDQMVEQGALLGYGDEISAGINTGFDTLNRLIHGKGTEIGSDYDKELKFRRAQKDEWERAHPVAKYGAEALGAVGSIASAPGRAVAAIPSVLQSMKQGGIVGAGVGAAAGFGSGEGGLENRALSAAQGGIVGGAIGAAAPPIVEGATAAYGAGRALLGFAKPEETAAREIATGIGRSGMTQDEIANSVQRANDLGVPGVPADTSLSLARLGRAVETIPGAASEATTRLLRERQIGQAGRVGGQLKRALGTDGHALETADAIISQRKAEAAPLYEESNNATGIWSPELDSLLKTPAARQAYARAKIIAANEREDPNTLATVGYMINPGDFGSYGKFKKPIQGSTPTMKSWDYIKRGLDDVLEKYRNPVTGKLQLNEAGRAVLGVKQNMLSELDALNPAYAKARQSFAGHSEMMDALHQGQDFAKGDVEMNARQFGALPESQQDMFRVGAVNTMRSTINKAKDGTDMYDRIFGSPDKRARIAMLFKDPREYQVFSHIMELERQTTETRRIVTGGSVTGRIAAEQADLVTGAVEDAMHGHGPWAMAMNAGRRMISRAKGINEETAKKIAVYLFNPDANAARQSVNPQTVKGMVDASRRRVGLTGMATQSAAATQAVNQPQ